MSEHKWRERNPPGARFVIVRPTDIAEPTPPSSVERLLRLSEEHLRRVTVTFDNDWLNAIPIAINATDVDAMGVVFKPDGSIWISNFTLHIDEQWVLHASECRRFRFENDLLRTYYNLHDALELVPAEEAAAMRRLIFDSEEGKWCRARALTHAKKQGVA